MSLSALLDDGSFAVRPESIAKLPPKVDPEQVLVAVIVPHATRGRFGQQVMHFTLAFHGDGLVAFHHAEGEWRTKLAQLAQLGYPADEPWVDGFLEGLCRLKFAGHLF